jgi:hypothetical protein
MPLFNDACASQNTATFQLARLTYAKSALAKKNLLTSRSEKCISGFRASQNKSVHYLRSAGGQSGTDVDMACSL